MTSVNVVMSTYNGQQNIIKQLDSIFNQNGVEVKLTIRDDKSTDNTIETIREYIKNNPNYNIKLIEGDNVGYAKSFWLALRESEDAEYYAFADQDDIWKKDKLIKCINPMLNDNEIAQLSYCKMIRCDTNLNRLKEQVNILSINQLSKKLILTKTYNYGAATVINRYAKELVCRVWPEEYDLPHDLWVGIICYYFGKVHFINEELYYWIRYNTSVTGSGNKLSGIRFRLKETIRKKSYPNTSKYILENYDDLLNDEDKDFLKAVVTYRKNNKNKWRLIFDKEFNRRNIFGTVALKIAILLGWY